MKLFIILLAFSNYWISYCYAQKSIKIGGQVWTQENLNVNHFRNGDLIPEAKSKEEWDRYGIEGKPAWCYYNNDPVNGKKYGKLYNWYAVIDPRGLAPKGWHIPSDAEWSTLRDYLGGQLVAGGKLKSTRYWNSPNIGATNSTGFAGLPGGSRWGYCEFKDPDETWGICAFEDIGDYGKWWSSTVDNYNTKNAWAWTLQYGNSEFGRGGYGKRNGFSVRCVRD